MTLHDPVLHTAKQPSKPGLFMFHSYASENTVLTPVGDRLTDVIWVDIENPTAAEEAQIEAAYGLEIPTRADMEEIEISSRLYSQGKATYMTAVLPANSDDGDPEMGPVTFILTEDHLVTVRYHAPRVFATFPLRAARTRQEIRSAEYAMVALMEAVIDRQADILERTARDVDSLSRQIFRTPEKEAKRDFQALLVNVGQMGDLNSNIRDSLLTLERLIGHLGQVFSRRDAETELRERVRTLANDAKSLTDHAGFVASKITFLLDASLGMINIEQNAIIKIFSVAAVIFLPPTLVASLYGMNFRNMPELSWAYGYPFAIGLMVVFAVLPYLYFKYRNWL